MTSKATKAKRKALPVFTLAELDRQKGIEENFDHLMGPLDRWLRTIDQQQTCGPTDGPEVPSQKRNADAFPLIPKGTEFD